MKSQKKNDNNDNKIRELNEALEFAQQVDQKIQEFNVSSAQVANKWQNKVENQVKTSNN
ncbi:hypothetical protein H1P_510027 [Hyella patelloides LEGE 07179]|uniref:Uncharacterized protein n=1 Tax=Hyella patelloides LEGE 07179 TaxID=945734 RepID=A0A563VZP7_9CYAN|nr:hypothetical protein [Hyella patelloides]VEP16924.1 hypothetical protein H1P_510027 [Hyella patelloides LEGE 07179]